MMEGVEATLLVCFEEADRNQVISDPRITRSRINTERSKNENGKRILMGILQQLELIILAKGEKNNNMLFGEATE